MGDAQTPRAEPGRGFWESLPTLSPWDGLCPELLRCTGVFVGLLLESCEGPRQTEGEQGFQLLDALKALPLPGKTQEVR